MEFVPTSICGVIEIRHDLRSDSRGRFRRQYCEREFAAAGLITRWVQTNHSVTVGSGTIRGMHFQRPPKSEAKLVSCLVGKAYDVIVDLRVGSETFLQWEAVEIDETKSVYVPEGCAHGFQTLAAEVHLIYQHSEFYSPETECGVRFDDPEIAIQWPLSDGVISDRDRAFGLIDEEFEGIEL